MKSGQQQAQPVLPAIFCYDDALFEVTDQHRLGGSALISRVFRKTDDDSLWVGKSNVLDTELAAKSEACREKIASDIYRYYGVTVPETALARLPIQLPEWAITMSDLGEMVKGGRKHTVYHLSKIIAGFHTFGSIPQFRGQDHCIILQNPDHGALNAIGLGHVLAVAKFIFDVDVIGGSGGNIGYQIIDGEAKVIKIDPGEAFNSNDLLNGEREVRTATQASGAVIQWTDFPKEVKREFLETLQLIVETPDEIIARFFMREGAESLLFHSDAKILREMPRMMIKRRDALRKSFSNDLKNVEGRRPPNFLQTRKIEQRDILATLETIRPRTMRAAISIEEQMSKSEVYEAAVLQDGGEAQANLEPPKIKTMATALKNLPNHDEADLVRTLEEVWDLGTGDDKNKQKQFREAHGFGVLFPFLEYAQKEILLASLNLIRKAIKDNKVNQQAFLDSNGIVTICHALAHESGSVQIASINLMLVYTHCNEENQAHFREGGVLPCLISLLKSQNGMIKESAMRVVIDYAICNNSTPNTDNLAIIWSLIKPEMLINLLKDSERVSYDALILVVIFIRNIEAQKNKFIHVHGIPELVRLLGCGNPKFVIKAADGLRYLSRIGASTKSNVVNQNSIREEGGIVGLLALLENADANVRSQALVCLYYVIDGNRVNQDMVRAEGGIKKIVDLLQDPDASVLGNAVTALHWVTNNHSENLLDSQKSGALEALKKIQARKIPETQKHIDRVIATFEWNLTATKNACADQAAEGSEGFERESSRSP